MLQLPTKLAPAIKGGPLKGFPDARPFNCPVLALMAKYEQVLSEYDKASAPVDGDNKALNRLCARMDQIAERASRLIPSSFEGAAFQVMLASSQPVNGTTAKLRREASERMNRLLRGALSRLDFGGACDAFPMTRACFMPAQTAQV